MTGGVGADGTQTQQLQMLPMSNSDVQPGATETQQMRVMAPPGVSYCFSLTDDALTSCSRICGYDYAWRLRLRVRRYKTRSIFRGSQLG